MHTNDRESFEGYVQSHPNCAHFDLSRDQFGRFSNRMIREYFKIWCDARQTLRREAATGAVIAATGSHDYA